VNMTGGTFADNSPYSYAVARAGTVSLPSPITDPARFMAIGGNFTNPSLTTNGGVVFLNFTAVPVPEPGAVLVLCAAAAGVARVLRRRKS
jgi:hypothetical protein